MGGVLVRILAAAALLAGQPAYAEPAVPSGWPELLNRLAEQSVEAVAAGGMSIMTRGSEGTWRGAVDFTSGYVRRGHSLFGWNERGYQRIGDDLRGARPLKVLGRPEAIWEAGSAGPPLETFPQTSVITQRAWSNAIVTSVVKSDTGGGCQRYQVELAGVAPITVTFCPRSTTLVTSGQTTVWTIEAVSVSPPPVKSVVAEKDYGNAEMAVTMRELAHSFIRKVRRDCAEAADPVACIQRTGDLGWGRLRVHDVRDGVMLVARNRYIDTTWKVTHCQRVCVEVFDHHPASWTPPLTPVTVAPAQPATAVGALALSRTLHAVAWGEGQSGEQLTMEGGERLGVDHISGVYAMIGGDGRPTKLRGMRGMECDPLERTAAVRRALRRAGKPAAHYVCEYGGDTDLAWAGLAGPAGWMLPLMPMVHKPSTSMDSVSITVPGQARLGLTGEALTTVAFLSADAPGAWSYNYGRQDLHMPPAEQRISRTRLDAALKPGSHK